MLKLIVVPLLFLSICLSCMGQTFQYSRGWTNGKRSSDMDNPNGYLPVDSLLDNKLDRFCGISIYPNKFILYIYFPRCLMMLRRCSHLPLKESINKKLYSNGNGGTFEDIPIPDNK